MTTTAFPTTISIHMPDDTFVELDVIVIATLERNPFGKEVPQYSGEDDGWTITEITPL